MSEKYFSLESIKQDVEWLISSGNQELPLREVLERFECGAIRPAKVRPEAHGRWEPGNPICPICGESKFKELDADIWADWIPPYCPNCGADMREEKP